MPSLFLLRLLRRRLEHREAFKVLMSQITDVNLPISKIVFFDFVENKNSELSDLEDLYKVRIKLDVDKGGNIFVIVVSGFKSHVNPAVDDLKALIAEISRVKTTEHFVPKHLIEEIRLAQSLESMIEGDNVDLSALIKISDETISFTGTESQVRRTESYTKDLICKYYYQIFTIPDSLRLDIGMHVDVYVSAVISPGQFWVQVVDENAGNLDRLQDNLCENVEHLLPISSLAENICCAAPYLNDPLNLYRAKMMKSENEAENSGRCWVYFVDYGDKAEVSKSSLKQLDLCYCELPAQAHQCRLASYEKSDDLSHYSLEKFKKLCRFNEWVPLRMIISGTDQDGNTLVVKLFNKNSNVEILPNLFM